MCPGLSDNLQQVDDARKTAVMNQELAKRNIDIAALQAGVGFAVRDSILSSVEPPSEGTERILSLCLTTFSGPLLKIRP